MAPLDGKLRLVVGDKTAKVLADQLGIFTIEDLLRHYPRRYVIRGELTDIESLNEGEEVTIYARVESCKVRRIPGRKGAILEAIVTDGRAKLSLTFFNQAWREKDLQEGRSGLFAGKVGIYKGKRQLAHPDYLLIPEGNDVESAASEFAGKFLPVYPATAKLPSWKISQCVQLALSALDDVDDPIPDEYRERFAYPSLKQALIDVHQPTSADSAERAKERLTFDEALSLQVFLVQRKSEIRTTHLAKRRKKVGSSLEQFDKALPFTFTAGQVRVSKEIEEDLLSEYPMYRLLQGDVGSGKTIIALRSMLAMVDCGAQAALLAPTEVLAQQHFRNFNSLLGPLAEKGMLGGSTEGTRVTLLTGSLTAQEKSNALQLIASGESGIIIGTHALLSEGVEFDDLALIVVDEQHRFGVEQRDALRAKSETPPHVLVMTATPIPRTVAMTVFGDLDVSTLDEMPVGRATIESFVVHASAKPQHLERAWQRIREEVSAGHQVYVVAPRISKSDNSDLIRYGLTSDDLALAKRMSGDDSDGKESAGSSSVEELLPRLSSGALKGLRVKALHGRMPADEKESVMNAFSKGEVDVLVSTTVIEVGVDVSNASMMVIMDADRFGVSQLHQLRGRIGRGSIPSICLFVTEADDDSPSMKRLQAVASTRDGFELSRIDLEERREGDVLGSAQSGVRSHLRLLRVLRDEDLIIKAREIAIEIVDKDSELASHPKLKSEVDKLREEERAEYLEKK